MLREWKAILKKPAFIIVMFVLTPKS
jgi:hypothetical protein